MAVRSLGYRVLRLAVGLMGAKKFFARPLLEIIKITKQKTLPPAPPTLSHPAMSIATQEIAGSPVVFMKHRQPTDRACMLLVGGGWMRYPTKSSLKTALRMGLETGRDMIIPYYPLCLEQPVTCAYQMIYALYRDVVNTYPAEKLIVSGSSSGGNLAMGLVAHINALKEGVPLPGKLYLSSPGNCFRDEKTRQLARKLNPHDILIDVRFIECAKTFMTQGEPVPDYMLYLEDGCYHGLKEAWLSYGSEEVLFSFCHTLSHALERDGVKVTKEIGEGLYHCYPFLPIVREAKPGWRSMIAYHKK